MGLHSGITARAREHEHEHDDPLLTKNLVVWAQPPGNSNPLEESILEETKTKTKTKTKTTKTKTTKTKTRVESSSKEEEEAKISGEEELPSARVGSASGETNRTSIAIAPTNQDAGLSRRRRRSESFSSFSSRETPILSQVLLRKKSTDSKSAVDSGSVILDAVDDYDYDSSSNLARCRPSQSDRTSEMVVTGLAVVALTGILGDLLSNYEWLQTLRYFWPLSLGIYYGGLWNQRLSEETEAFYEEYGTDAATVSKNDDRNVWLQIGYVFGGFGLLVGGLADALLPVWMTGPNLLTHAGLAPDCAFLLLALSVGENYGWIRTNNNTKKGGDNNNNNNSGDNPSGNTNSNELLESSFALETSVVANNNSTNNNANSLPLLVKVALWAELYKLGESSIDEVLSLLRDAISSAT
eukprot:CAMPEP_0172408634 /NCGR_PEP_ID=MMETSP1061-20121228/75953_1 /TAXON_ID=37318 /ORGANISM="Pseudo-nitzschia pungens, Strain cf. pungens" /LENGTH=410 /DNA_ID=CAMNT_0013144771 /DNA_START=2159 /DNA_END=3392 /DNA_ORIENTATION=-